MSLFKRRTFASATRTRSDCSGGDLNLVGTGQAANLHAGTHRQFKFHAEFRLATLRASPIRPGIRPSEGLANKVKLDIASKRSRPEPYEQRRKLQGQANLHVSALPLIRHRRANRVYGGDIFLMNKRYQIERGVIEFSNPQAH